ncbi:uncharacterized protein MYCGRDRAFT_92724 [Zymoseptoria tritici IPO323]|uniref:Uncharacterized protein n=1 Tax=Zymoseptoria tritici (strain CBS 115943 / IPO323) TaxID=336722 RepID=F9X9Z6_ZYMTI|nr:uncharacterized protein MYCGRDRAFT_92724 [Zymoseptoria tritici IPO323]EGP88301.1 hypothetical protein MYCGRDRAFT_92724 [Zymoseptoria tritici IPO323]
MSDDMARLLASRPPQENLMPSTSHVTPWWNVNDEISAMLSQAGDVLSQPHPENFDVAANALVPEEQNALIREVTSPIEGINLGSASMATIQLPSTSTITTTPPAAPFTAAAAAATSVDRPDTAIGSPASTIGATLSAHDSSISAAMTKTMPRQDSMDHTARKDLTNPSDFEDQIVLQELLDVLSSQFCRYHGASNPATGSVVLDAVANPDNKYNFVYIEPPPPDVSSRVREDGTVMDGEIPEPEQEVQDEHAAQGSDNDDDDWQAAAERHDSERRQQQQSEELPKTEPCQLPPTSRTLPYMSPKFLFLRPGLQYLFVLTVPLGHTFDLFDEIRRAHFTFQWRTLY